MSRRRYVANEVRGGYRIWENTTGRWWRDLYKRCPDDLLTELDRHKDYQTVTDLLKRYRAQER